MPGAIRAKTLPDAFPRLLHPVSLGLMIIYRVNILPEVGRNCVNFSVRARAVILQSELVAPCVGLSRKIAMALSPPRRTGVE